MGCEHVEIEGGVAIICSRGRRRRTCSTPGCGRRVVALCDFRLTGAKAGKTCDRPLCALCAVRMGRHESGEDKGDTIDYCPAHAEQTRRGEAPATPAAAPVVQRDLKPGNVAQVGLFEPPATKRR